MNVLVIPNYFDRDGGATKILTEGKYLARLGVRLVIVVPCNPFARADVAAKLRALGLSFYFAPTHFRTLYLFFPYSLWALRRIIRRERIDIIHTHHGRTLLLGVILSRLERIPLVYTIHGISRRELPLAMKGLLFRSVSRVIAISEECAAHFRLRVPTAAARVVVSRNGVDFSHFREAAPRPGDGLDLLYISRLDRDKRRAVEAVMAAAARVFAEEPRVRLSIVGDGRQGGAVCRRARAINSKLGREVINVIGWVDDPRELYAASDAVLGVGRCVLEAIAIGRPVLVAGSERVSGWVRADAFPALQAANFSGRGAGVTVSGPNLARELMRIPGLLPRDAAAGGKVREMARRDHDAEGLAREIRAIYLQAAGGYCAAGRITPEAGASPPATGE